MDHGQPGGMPGMGDGMHMHGMSGPMWMPAEPPDTQRLLSLHLQPVPVMTLLALAGLVGYGVGVARLHRSGVRWSLSRTISWALGILVVGYVTTSGVEGYGMAMFSVHMAQHMALAMLAPIFLTAGAPVTLALRALPTTGRGSGVRRTVVRALGSRVLKVLTFLPVRWFLFLSGLYGIYFTGIFDLLMASVWGHLFMMLHFLATGILFFGPIVGVDPWPGRNPPFFRLLESLASVPFHAFFGIAIMAAGSPLLGFFLHPPPGWGLDVVGDQTRAGGIAWATSEIPTLLLTGYILVAWFRSEERQNVRTAAREARADRELAEYNDYLAAIHGRTAGER